MKMNRRGEERGRRGRDRDRERGCLDSLSLHPRRIGHRAAWRRREGGNEGGRERERGRKVIREGGREREREGSEKEGREDRGER